MVGALSLPRRAGATAAVALVSGLLLPLAPVDVSRVDVSWPESGAVVESTALLLVNQTPYVLEATFDSDTVREAAQSGGLILSTIDPASPDARELGLVAETDGESVTVTQRGAVASVAATASTTWELRSTVDGTTLTADGRPIADWPEILPPQVDALLTDAQDAPGALAARLQIVDDANSEPSPGKIVLMIVLALAVAATLLQLAQDDRAHRAAALPPRRDGIGRRLRRHLSPWDAVVAAGLVLWAVIGPMTDDDGYYAQMALNYPSAGYVGNYFQMFDQTFTPFSWFWQFLSWWQEIGGRAPLWLRLPAVAAGITAWFLARRFLDATLAERGVWLRRAGRAMLGIAFLAWWFAYPIGSRPEALGALAGVIALVASARAVEQRRLLPVAVGALAAGLAFAAHPTGAVAFAPLVIGIPAFWSIARSRGTLRETIARTVAVLSVGAVALFAAFADGALRDVLSGRALFASVETPLGPLDERIRYSLLLSDSPMGSYAKRAVVLLALVLLVWFLLTVLARRLRGGSAFPFRLSLVGWTLPLSLAALLITPSKWTHHFGAIAAVGPLFIALVALGLPAVVRALARGRTVPPWLAPLAVVSLVPVIVLAFRGLNTWAYAWNTGLPHPGVPPQIAGVPLASVPLWLGLAAAVLIATALVLRRQGRTWRDPSALYGTAVLAGVFLLLSTGYLGAGFAATLAPSGGISVAAATASDPTGVQCRVANSVRFWDASAGRPLAESSPPSTPPASDDLPVGQPFVSGGWPSGDAPPAGVEGWGSHAAGDAAVGVLATPWYLIGDPGVDERIAILTGGRITESDATALSFEFAAADGTPLAALPVADTAARPGWTTLVAEPAAIPSGSRLVRVIAVDGSTVPGGWLALSAPVLVPAQTLGEAFPADAPTAIGWTMSFWFPCQRPMALSYGIIEPPVLATTWGPGAPDNIWLVQRGGSVAGAARLAAVTTAASEMAGVGSWWGRVELFDYGVARDAYDLSTSRVRTWGFTSPFGPLPQLVDADRR